MKRILLALGLAFLALSPAVSAGAADMSATAIVVDGTGNAIGKVQFDERGNGVRLRLTLNNADVVQPGTHGLHFHAIGRCDGPDFTSAGGHFNPHGAQHGHDNPQGAHAGDLPNLSVDNRTRSRDGSYSFTAVTHTITLSPGPASIFDADGTALVIHANPDDEVTDPSGNSGPRLACATIMPGLPKTGEGGMAGQAAGQIALNCAVGTLLFGAALWMRLRA
jgi:Cu-Zn family superoxide dismutase